jgi:hypothetical protein
MSKERQAVASYVADLSAELAQIAHEHGLDMAAYMLEMAAAEAATVKSDTDSEVRRTLRVVAA